jgi:hypothetical protein
MNVCNLILLLNLISICFLKILGVIYAKLSFIYFEKNLFECCFKDSNEMH